MVILKHMTKKELVDWSIKNPEIMLKLIEKILLEVELREIVNNKLN